MKEIYLSLVSDFVSQCFFIVILSYEFLVVHTIDGDVVQDRTEEVDSGSHEARVDEQHWDSVFFKLTGHWGSDSTFISEIDHQLEVQVNDVIHEVNQEVTVIDIDERKVISITSQHR